MSNLADIEKIQTTLRLMEERLAAVRGGLHNVERDIDILSTHAAQLNRNVHYLKRKKVIALASEYKKVKEELTTVNTRLAALRSDRENFRTVYARAEVEMFKLKEELDILIHDPGAKVIEADFRRLRGR